MSAPSASTPAHVERLMDGAREIITDVVLAVLPTAFPEVTADDATSMRGEIVSKMAKVTVKGQGDLALPCFVFAKKIKGPPAKTAETLAKAVNDYLEANKNEQTKHIVSVKGAGPYLNFGMSVGFVTSVVSHILSGAYLQKRPSAGRHKVMIEYSQPNTHKAFHVGHMRNVALGDSLVRLYETVGHEVVAVNYFGDEGAHVAKCLWFLTNFLKTKGAFNIDTDVLPQQRGEWLGAMYSSAVDALDLSSLTAYPFPQVIAAKVLKVENHPAADAPPNWHVVTLQIDQSGKEATVVCGGKGYKEGDLVAYMPVGSKIKGDKITVEPKDMKGVVSHGIMMASKELGIEEEAAPAPAAGEKKEKAAAAAPKEKKEKPAPKPAAEKKEDAGAAASSSSAPKEKKENKGKAKEDRDSPNNQIHLFPASLPIGVEVTELGRKTPLTDAELAEEQKKARYYLPFPAADKKVVKEIEERTAAAREMLLNMEAGEPTISALWQKTKEWSLTEFKNIYAWLNARFDYDFYESECSEPSRKLVEEYRNKVFFDSNGALGADLSKYNLGFCMVLKSDGSGLYATKDLALAKRKFDEFKVDQSIYIVDAAQTLHFKQVFKTLELMGYDRAKNCIHIPYGQVVLPDGKMSSRKGTVIFFSQLRELLKNDIYTNFLAKYDPDRIVTPEQAAAEKAAAEKAAADAAAEGKKVFVKIEKNTEKWTKAELEAAQQQIAVATIKYGMLNHDVTKDIVFVLEEWTARSGNTGVYMMYAYARIQSIIREVKLTPGAKVDFELLTHEADRNILTLMHDMWDVLDRTVELNNPSTLCNYLFELSKTFSSWYEIPACSVNNAATEDLKATRIEFIRSIAKIIQFGLGLLGIKTLERM